MIAVAALPFLIAGGLCLAAFVLAARRRHRAHAKFMHDRVEAIRYKPTPPPASEESR